MTKDSIRFFLSWTAWPFLFVSCMIITYVGFLVDRPVIFFNIAYLFLIVSLLLLERFMPHEKKWNEDDGQFWPNIFHTLMSKGTVQSIVIFSSAIGLSTLVTSASTSGYGIWPREWPLWVQVPMGIIIAEFGLYWAHRAAHEWPFLWRFHSIHHSVTRLWIVNTGRFHFIDSLVSISLSMLILLSLGAPMEVLVWLSATTAFLGMLTHCNVEMRFGAISWIFNTPGLHRWHHSRDLREGNKNYGENLMLWDQIFGTYINPSHRPPVNIGIDEYMPASFWGQLAHPFRRKKPKNVEKQGV